MIKKIFVFVFCALFLSSIFLGCTQSSDTAETDEVVVEEVEETAEPEIEEVVEAVVEEPEQSKMIVNGDFALGYENWGLYTEGTTCELAPADGQAQIPVEKTGTVEWAIQLYHDGILLSEGCTYKIKFDITSSVPRSSEVRIQKNGSPYTGYFEEIVEINEKATSFEFDFLMEYESDQTCRIVFNLGKFEGEELEPHNIQIDNVYLELTGGEPVDASTNSAETNNIRINQLGYKPHDNKIAAFVEVTIDEFKVVNADGQVVFVGEIGEGLENPNSNELVRLGDFSSVTEQGTYHIEVDEQENSYDFAIAEDIYSEVSDAVLKTFYYQRCSMELTEEHAGDFAHGACHLQEAKIYGTDEYRDVSGGWHDAGDYGRYVTAASKSVIDLLIAYESNPEKYADDSGIPESGNGIPDILDEVKYELDFLLKMQDETTGGVYHKVTPANFAGEVMPDEATDELIISPISGVATADFAAIMAKASVIYKTIDEEFANTCLDQSSAAWNWLESNPNEHGFTNPPEIQTGEYGDDNSLDERFWAAAELYSATGEDKYHTYLKNSEIYGGMGWQDIGQYGVIAYLKLPSDKQDTNLSVEMKKSLIKKADEIIENSKKDIYQNSLTTEDYVWGSNMHVANNAMTLLIANSISENQEYVDVAYEHLNYLLGKNPLSISYITGFGTNKVYNIHHRVIQVVEEPFNGLLIGGPNANLEDPYAQTMLSEAPPAKCYADNEQSYSTNEIAIYWNSPTLYLVDYFK